MQGGGPPSPNPDTLRAARAGQLAELPPPTFCTFRRPFCPKPDRHRRQGCSDRKTSICAPFRLNTTGREWAGSPTNMFEARRNGGNIIFNNPTHDLGLVWPWSSSSSQGLKRIVDAITN
jgi:hypothetical protein